MGTALPTETGFDRFYREHRARLVATLNAASRCGADAATEAVDEAFVRALAHWNRVQRMEAPAGWVFTVARNQLRRTTSRKVVEQQLAHRVAHGDTSAAADVANWELWEAVGALPDRERTAVALRYLADMTERQVAETMGIAPGTVAATLHAARKHLAERLTEPMEVATDGRA